MRHITYSLLLLLVSCSSGLTQKIAWPEPDGARFVWHCVPEVTDPELMYIWEPQQSRDAAKCANPVVATWDHTPVTVAVLGEPYVDPTEKAIKAWNHWLGMTVFVRWDPGSGIDPDVLVMHGDNPSPVIQFIAYVDHITWKGRLHSFVNVMDETEVSVGTMAHEFGHVLGLSHEFSNEFNIMSYDRGMTWVAPRDRAALRRLYAR